MLNYNEDQLKMLLDGMVDLKNWYANTALGASLEIVKQRAINDTIRCNRIIDEIEKELISLEEGDSK